ncbi:MAG: hypothetical protein EBU90_30020, partial [Proteobacteria bacterium]|nr:hypothetical protein [Pseudomonadota bacterium]
NNVTTTINKTLQGFSADYQRRLKQVDDAKPIGILGKFLDVYKTALGFINFFGNKRNIDKVRDNLEALKKSFTESFEVAKLIRQVIIKIVKQLSNLPVASPSGGGGLNLDIDIPGGGLKKSAPRGLGRMMKGKGKMLALGAGALGLGVAGGAAVNALSDSPQAQAAGTSPEIPGDIGDKFSSIVDRFANAVSGGTKPSAAPGSSPSPGSMPVVSGEGTPEQQAMLKTLRFSEGTTKSYGTIFGGNTVKELEEGKLTVQETINMADTGKLPQRLGGGAIPGYGKGSKATGAYEFMPYTLEGLIKQGALDPNEMFTNKVQDRAALQLAANRGVTADLLKKEGFSANVSNKLAPEWASVPTLSGRSFYGQPVKSLSSLQNVYNQSISAATPSKTGMGGPAVDASMISPEARKALGIQISQPPPSQQQQQPVVMPINLGGGGQQQTSGGGVSGPPPSQGSGPSVP